MIDLRISSRVQTVDLEPLEAAFSQLLEDLSDLFDALPDAFDNFDPEDLSSFGASGLGWSWLEGGIGTMTLGVSGSGFAPTGSPEDFFQALFFDGTATGTLSGITLAANGIPVVDVQLSPDAFSISAGSYRLALDGVFPTDLGDLSALFGGVVGLVGGDFDPSDLPGLLDEFDEFEAVGGLSVSGISLTDGAETLFALDGSESQISLELVGGLSLVANGTFPGGLEALGNVALALLPALDGGLPDPDDPALEGIDISDVTIRDGRGSLIKAKGDFLDFEIGRVDLTGTGKRDVIALKDLPLISEESGVRIAGRGGNDKITGAGKRDIIDGGNGKDLLNGKSGRDVIDGGKGADTINGGRGDDKLTGGGFRDFFVFGPRMGDDVITDFANNRDTLRLDDRLWGGEDLTARQVVRKFGSLNEDGDVELHFLRGDSLTLNGIGNRGVLVDDIEIV